VAIYTASDAFVRRRLALWRNLAGGAGAALVDVDLRVQLASTNVATALGARLAAAPSSVAASVAQALQGSQLAAANVLGAVVLTYPVASAAAPAAPTAPLAAFGAAAAAGTAASILVVSVAAGWLFLRQKRRAQQQVAPEDAGFDKRQRGASAQGLAVNNSVDVKNTDEEGGDDGGVGVLRRVVEVSSLALSSPTSGPPLRLAMVDSMLPTGLPPGSMHQLLPSGGAVADALSSAAGGLATVLASAAPSVPLAGLALSAIAALLSQLQNMRVAEREAGVLAARLARLQTLVQRASGAGNNKDEDDEAGTGAASFADEHPAIFRGLVDTLRRAERALAQMGERSRLGAFIGGSGDSERVAAADRAISLHVAELSAALSAETMASVRALHSRMRSAQAATTSASGTPQAPLQQQPPTGRAEPRPATPEPAIPLPPFSMNIVLADLAFDPPLDHQLQTAVRGANGVVVFATWRARALPVAVKVMNARMATGEAAIPITSWLAEAELMRRLREHRPRFVVTLFGISATLDALGNTDRYLVIMERLSGGSLRAALDAYLARGRRPPLATALQWLLETARGVAECHAAGVVHSDIKASNVLLDGARRAKLGDLGSGRVTRGLSASASALAVTATSAGAGRSSVLWLSSELVDDPKQLPSTFSDVFAWAVTAFEVLSCRLPYHGADGVLQVDVLRPRVMMDLVSGKLRPDLAAVRADAPPAVVELVRRCWAAEPRDRPEMAEVVLALEAAASALAVARLQAAEREAQAATSDAQSDALRAAAAAAAEEDARAAAAELAALRASVGEARTARLAAIQRRHEEAEAALRAEAAAAAASLEAEGAAWLAAETARAEEILAARRRRLLDEAAAARATRLREGGATLDDAERARIVAEFERERDAVEAKLEEERARQHAALEARLAERRAAKARAAEERAAARQLELAESARREAEAERARGDEEVLRAAFEFEDTAAPGAAAEGESGGRGGGGGGGGGE
jgi:hypothetical protein